MADKRVVAPASLGEPIGPFVRGIAAGGLVAISGTSALSHLSGPANERVLVPDFESQARQTFANLETALDAAGLGWEHAVQMTVILTGREDCAAFEAVRTEALGSTPVTRTVAIAGLLRAEMLIEIDLWAVEPDGGVVVGGAGAGVAR
jgi:enamine deaminase RidA (YjgF/YER057c/UK114 family)